jgi:hypothetical protein
MNNSESATGTNKQHRSAAQPHRLSTSRAYFAADQPHTNTTSICMELDSACMELLIIVNHANICAACGGQGRWFHSQRAFHGAEG